MTPEAKERALKEPKAFLETLLLSDFRMSAPEVDQTLAFISASRFYEAIVDVDAIKELARQITVGCPEHIKSSFWLDIINGRSRVMSQKALHLLYLAENFEEFRAELLRDFTKAKCRTEKRNAILDEKRPALGSVVRVKRKNEVFYGILEGVAEAYVNPICKRAAKGSKYTFNVVEESLFVRPILSATLAHSDRKAIKTKLKDVTEVSEQEAILAFLKLFRG